MYRINSVGNYLDKISNCFGRGREETAEYPFVFKNISVHLF